MSENKSAIGGKLRENQDFGSKVIGLGEVEVVAVNPSREEFKTILGRDLEDDSKADTYLGESKEGNTSLRIDVWVKAVKTGKIDKIVFFLENKQRENKDGTKKQYINSSGSCSWADDENNLPEWFVKREYRVAYNGEEDLYNFLRTWLGKLDYRDSETVLQLDWKTLMKGNVKDIRSQIGGAYCTSFVAPFTVKTVTKEENGEQVTKEYQSIYNKAFLPTYALKQFKLVDYSKDEVQDALKKKKSKDLKPHERFVLQMANEEHGCRDMFSFKEVHDYNPEEFLVASDKPISDTDSEY